MTEVLQGNAAKTEAETVAVLQATEQHLGAGAAIASSFGVEDIVLLHLARTWAPSARVFTLDTGRLPEETHAVMDTVRRRFQLEIDVYAPDTADVEQLVRIGGAYSFRESLEARRACCHVRKVAPLRRALAGRTGWLTGLRREQMDARADVPVISWDDENGLWKANPLAGWTTSQLWDYVREHHLPYNTLHDVGYASIGCAPCTRAVKPWEPLRAGRWWWEAAEHKECGLHRTPGTSASAATGTTP